MAHKGIHSRGYLPHWDLADSVQAITFRLADSLPADLLREWKRELRDLLNSPDLEISRRGQADLHSRISEFEDVGHGSCLLGNPEHAQVLQDILVKGHGEGYKLIDWCIMPNHVHVLVRLLDDTSLGEIIKNWKGSSAILINRLEGRSGSLWMPDYHDRLIRDLDHLENVKAYIRKNPVKAGLCKEPGDWPFSGAGANWSAEFIPREGLDPRGVRPSAEVSECGLVVVTGEAADSGRNQTGSAEFIPRESMGLDQQEVKPVAEVSGDGLEGAVGKVTEGSGPDETGSRGINSNAFKDSLDLPLVHFALVLFQRMF